MKISLPKKHATLCIIAVASLPCLYGQDPPEDALDQSSPLEIAGPTIQGEAHENLVNIDEFIEARFSMMAMADPDRLYDPLGVVKDGAIEPPKDIVVIPPDEPDNGNPTNGAEPIVDQLKTEVDSLTITGFNSGGGSILLGVSEISIGQFIPRSKDVFLSDVKPSQITFKSKSTGKEYSRPVGFNPKGVQSRSDFLNSIEGVNRR